MTDIVERLRAPTSLSCGTLHWKAADEIEGLREDRDRLRELNTKLYDEFERLRAALEDIMDVGKHGDHNNWSGPGHCQCHDFARKALGEKS